MPRVTTYNPKKVTLALGNHIASGFADDSFIVIEPAGDGNSYVDIAVSQMKKTTEKRLKSLKLEDMPQI